MPEFKIGDRVVCHSGRISWQTGLDGIIEFINEGDEDTLLHVRFSNGKRDELYARRFELDTAPNAVCRKIRQMEKRWLNYQQRKANEMG